MDKENAQSTKNPSEHNKTLRARIAIMMIVFLIVLVSAFTLVQLQNQLRTITIFNSLKAKLSVQTLKSSIENKLRGLPKAEHSRLLLDCLGSIEGAGLMDSATVYTLDGIIEASTTSIATGKKVSKSEFVKIQESKSAAAIKEKKYSTYIYKGSRVLEIYFPVSIEDQLIYVVKAEFSLGNMAEAAKQVYIPVIITSVIVIAGMLFFGTLLTKRVIDPISLLNTASKEMAAGDLNLRIHMDTGDELQELADTFNIMAVELKKMKQKAENANPLTKLPGNIVIQEEVDLRIRKNEKFLVVYSDLDNFKAFNDKYGIHKGDLAIELAANIIKEASEKHGSYEDFIGHEGGDDFLLLTRPEQAEAITDYIITEFDKRIRGLYAKEDLERGFLEEKARHGEEILKYPIMTISLAGVTNQTRPFSTYSEITNVAAEVKKKAKMTEGSCFVADKRKLPWPPGEPRPT